MFIAKSKCVIGNRVYRVGEEIEPLKQDRAKQLKIDGVIEWVEMQEMSVEKETQEKKIKKVK